MSEKTASSFADVEAIFAPTHVRLPIRPDGNCFFASLAAFFQITAHPLAGKTELELRNILVETMLPNIKDLLPYVAREYKVKNPTLVLRYKTAFVTTEVKKLRRPFVYDTDLGDIVPQESTRAFGIRLVIHDWNWNTMRADVYFLDPPVIVSDLPTIHLLRTNENHYDLLLPLSEMNGPRFEIYETLRAMFEADVAEEQAEEAADAVETAEANENVPNLIAALQRSGVEEVQPSLCCGVRTTAV